MQTDISQPGPSKIKLAPPGAGLPWIELQAARCIFFFEKMCSNKQKANQLIIDEKKKILSLIQLLSEERLKKEILIKRLAGMEDSSRNWSIYMTISHLAIVNTVIIQAIKTLCVAKTMEHAASTAAVKPSPHVGKEVELEFKNTCEELITASQAQENLKTTVTYTHPWFGSLDASSWHFLAGFHMRLHRKQIECIIKEL